MRENTARAELTDLIHAAYPDDGWLNSKAVAASLTASGFRKPRTITTVGELDALPVGSVAVTRIDEVISKRLMPNEGRQSWWAMAGTAEYFESRELPLPATVLYEPETSK